MFNEGYAASAGSTLVRADLCEEAIRLAKLLAVLMPDEPEVLGLLALMLLQDSRREARVASDGEIILLEDQDRSLWIAGASKRDARPRARGVAAAPGPYQLQAAIAAAHAEGRPEAESSRSTPRSRNSIRRPSWSSTTQSPSRWPATSRVASPCSTSIEGLDGYHLLHAARADLCRRLERHGRGRELLSAGARADDERVGEPLPRAVLAEVT